MSVWAHVRDSIATTHTADSLEASDSQQKVGMHVQETLFILKRARLFGTEAGDVYQVPCPSMADAQLLQLLLHLLSSSTCQQKL